VSGDYDTDTLGIESPDGRSDPKHDRTKQYHLFGYAQEILDQNSSLTAVAGVSNEMFQIPNQIGLQPAGLDGIVGLGPQDPGTGNYVLQANGQAAFPSTALDATVLEPNAAVLLCVATFPSARLLLVVTAVAVKFAI